MRDWMKDLRPASYRGAKFWVDKDDYATGRRLVVHEFPHRDAPYVEDLGRKANTVTITAYVVSDQADREAASLRRACDAGGAAKLQLPLEGLKAHCQDFTRTHQKDRLGFIAFSITFVRDGTGPAPASTAYLSRLVSSSVASVAKAARAYFAARYAGLRVGGFVRDAAVARIQMQAARLDVARATMRAKASAAPAAARKVADLYADAGALAVGGQSGDKYTPTQFSRLAESSTSGLPERVDSAMSAIMDAADTPEEAAATFAQIIDLIPASESVATTPSVALKIANERAIDTLFRVTALSYWAAALAEREYADPRDARQARADVGEYFAAEIERIAPGPAAEDMAAALREISGHAVRFLSGAVADLAPVVFAETNERMPALWWAGVLYADGERAEELFRRNGVIHPLFMPRRVEALAA